MPNDKDRTEDEDSVLLEFHSSNIQAYYKFEEEERDAKFEYPFRRK